MTTVYTILSLKTRGNVKKKKKIGKHVKHEKSFAVHVALNK